MDYLIEFAERDAVREIAARYLEYGSVQAIDLDLDDLWLASWRLFHNAPNREFRDAWRYLEDWHFARRRWAPYWPAWLLDDEEFVGYPFGVDPNWMPPIEGELDKRWARWGPFVMTVVLRPRSSRQELGALQEIYPEGLPVRFEARPVPSLLARPTDAVRPVVGGLSVASPGGRPGTLGGIVEAGNKRLGLTCAHVLSAGEEAEQPAAADNHRDAARIGECHRNSKLVAHIPPLNAYSSELNEVDAALIELDDAVDADLEVRGVGALTRISQRSEVHPDSSVEIVGLRAKRRSLHVGKLRMVGEFRFGDEWYGYQNLFELRRRSRFHGFTGTISPPVNGGDSGAWVILPGASGPELAGVVVAGDGPYGYAILAQSIAEWIEEEGPYRPVKVC